MTLLAGSSFVIADGAGDIRPNNAQWLGSHGFYAGDTRMISRLTLAVSGVVPRLLDHQAVEGALTSISVIGDPTRPELLITRRTELTDHVKIRIDVLNLTSVEVAALLDLTVESDFADLFDVKRGVAPRAGFVGAGPVDGALLLTYESGSFHRAVRVVCSVDCEVLRDGVRIDLVAVAAIGAADYEVSRPRPLWSEQDPAEWWDGAQAAHPPGARGGRRDRRDVAAVGLTGQMHGLVLLDGERRVLRPAILWNDQRTAAQCDEIRRRSGRERLVGSPATMRSPASRRPRSSGCASTSRRSTRGRATSCCRRTTCACGSPATHAMDKADGSGTLLFDLARARLVATRCWARCDIPPRMAAADLRGAGGHGRRHARTRREATGLRAGTPVVAGGGDQAAGAVGRRAPSARASSR